MLGIQLVHDDIDTNRAGFLVGTPALLREYESCCATNSYDGLQLDGGSRSDVPVAQEYEQLIDNQATGYGQLVVYDTSAIEAEAQQAIRPEAIALAVFGGSPGRRADHRDPVHLPPALLRRRPGRGAARAGRRPGGNDGGRAARRRRRRRGRGAARGGGSRRAVAADLVRAGRQVEPAPGIDVDWTVLGPGVLVLALVLGLVAAAIAYRLAPHRAARRVRAAGRGSGVVAAALAAGLPVSGGAGLRFALEPGRGRTAVPVRSVMAGTVLAVAVGIATLTFGASLSTLISHPALYGWNFGYALYSVDGYGAVRRWADPLLARDPDVAASTGVYFATVQIDGQTVPAMAAPVPPAITPRPLTGTRWTGPARSCSARRRSPSCTSGSANRDGVRGAARPPVRLRIVGTAALPTMGDARRARLDEHRRDLSTQAMPPGT